MYSCRKMNNRGRYRQDYYGDDVQQDFYPPSAYSGQRHPHSIAMSAQGNGMSQYGREDMSYCYDQPSYYNKSPRHNSNNTINLRRQERRDDEHYARGLYNQAFEPHSRTTVSGTRTSTERTTPTEWTTTERTTPTPLQTSQTSSSRSTSRYESTFSSSTESDGWEDNLMSALNDMAGNVKKLAGIQCSQNAKDSTEVKQFQLPLPGLHGAMAALSPKKCSNNMQYNYAHLDEHVIDVEEKFMGTMVDQIQENHVYKSLFESQSQSSASEEDELEEFHEDPRYIARATQNMPPQQQYQTTQVVGSPRMGQNILGVPSQIIVTNEPSCLSSTDSWKLLSPRDEAHQYSTEPNRRNRVATNGNDKPPRDEQWVPATKQTLKVENPETIDMKKGNSKVKSDVPQIISVKDGDNLPECYSDLTTGLKMPAKDKSTSNVPAIQTKFSGDELMGRNSKASFRRNGTPKSPNAVRSEKIKSVDTKSKNTKMKEMSDEDFVFKAVDHETEEERKLKEEEEKVKKLREEAKKRKEERKQREIEAKAAQEKLEKQRIEEQVEEELQAAREALKKKRLEEERKQREAERKAEEEAFEAKRKEEERKQREAEAKAAEEALKAKILEAERKRIEAEAKAAQEALEAKRREEERKQREAEERAAKEAQKAKELKEERRRIEAETKAAQERLEALYIKKLDEEKKLREAEVKRLEEKMAQREAEAKRKEEEKIQREAEVKRKEEKRRIREAEIRALEAKRLKEVRERVEAETRATEREAKELEKERERIEAGTKVLERTLATRKLEKRRKPIEDSDQKGRASLYKVQGFNDYCKSVASNQIGVDDDVEMSDEEISEEEYSYEDTSRMEEKSFSSNSFSSGEVESTDETSYDDHSNSSRSVEKYSDEESDIFTDTTSFIHSNSMTKRLRNKIDVQSENVEIRYTNERTTDRTIQPSLTKNSYRGSKYPSKPSKLSSYTSNDIALTRTMSTLPTMSTYPTFDQSEQHSLGRFIKSSDESVVSMMSYSNQSIVSTKPIAIPVNTMPREVKKKINSDPEAPRSSILGSIISFILSMLLRVAFTVILFLYTWTKHIVVTIGKEQPKKIDCTPTEFALQPNQSIRQEEIQDHSMDNLIHQNAIQQNRAPLLLGYENPHRDNYTTTMIVKPNSCLGDDSDEVGTCVESIVPDAHTPNVFDGKISPWKITPKNSEVSSVASAPSTSFRVLKSAYSVLSSKRESEKSNWLDHATIDDELSYYE